MLSDIEQYSDEELVSLARDGSVVALDYLFAKYRNMVRSRVSAYFLIGADREDILQEGMIGLFKAVRDFKPGKISGFRAFADLCITRQIITAIKTATRQKHTPLNHYVSLNKPFYDEEYEVTLLDMITGNAGIINNPEEIMINRERYADIGRRMGQALSVFECKVLSLYLEGKPYQEIGKVLNRPPKSIDNALQRIKRKVQRVCS